MNSLYEALVNPRTRVRMADHIYYSPLRGQILDQLSSATLFTIDNVARFFFEELDRADRRLNRWQIHRHFPNLAPPFDNFWMEFVPPRESGLSGGLARLGVWFVVTDTMGSNAIDFANQIVIANGVKWQVNAFAFGFLHSGIVAGPYLAQMLPISESGNYLGVNGNPMGICLANLYDFHDDVDLLQMSKAILYPALLAISFLHCKNIIVAENQATRPERRLAIREGRQPITFKTLDIRPMQELLQREGQIENNGLQRALHICRGHFATYSQERPLFGRVSGTFWKSMHVRGSAQAGIVVKDYEIASPNKASAT